MGGTSNRSCIVLSTLLLAACGDEPLIEPPTPPPPPPPVEICNGVDDDGDTLVDEGFGDVDRDGIADCVDGECVLPAPSPPAVEVDPTCTALRPPAAQPWDVVVEWQGGTPSTDPTFEDVMGHLAIGRTRDTNGDGVIDESDGVDFASIPHPGSGSGGRLVLRDGATGNELWTSVDAAPSMLFWPATGVLMADLDGAPGAEVVALGGSPGGYVARAFSGSGELLWESETLPIVDATPMVSIADLGGDPGPELLVSHMVLRPSDGQVLDSISYPDQGAVFSVLGTVADIDGDGISEVLIRDRAWSLDGVELTFPIDSTSRQHWAVAQVDDDAEPELLLLESSALTVFEHDGVQRDRWTFGSASPGPPCVADLDGDGRVEVVHTGNPMRAMDPRDGSVLWNRVQNDPSGFAGCSAFDLDGDGAAEVLYADHSAFGILDGATGDVRWVWLGHTSGTAVETPLVADVDGDGSVEILVGSFRPTGVQGFAGITVFGHERQAWQAGGKDWPMHDFAPGRVDAKGRLVEPSPAFWDALWVHRSREPEETPAANLRVHLESSCWGSCEPDGRARVALRVSNQGAVASPSVSLDVLDPLVPEVPIATLGVPGLAPGEVSERIELTFGISVIPPDGLAFQVDGGLATGEVLDCDRSDNVVLWAESPCGD